jgi:hypothetical protein
VILYLEVLVAFAHFTIAAALLATAVTYLGLDSEELTVSALVTLPKETIAIISPVKPNNLIELRNFYSSLTRVEASRTNVHLMEADKSQHSPDTEASLERLL